MEIRKSREVRFGEVAPNNPTWPDTESRQRPLFSGYRRHSNIFIRRAVVEQPPLWLADQAFHKHHVRDLSGFLPRQARFEYGSIRPLQHLRGVVLVEQQPARPID